MSGEEKNVINNQWQLAVAVIMRKMGLEQITLTQDELTEFVTSEKNTMAYKTDDEGTFHLMLVTKEEGDLMRGKTPEKMN